MPAGYLWVMSEPGEAVTLEEFTDWYDNEHVPLRMGQSVTSSFDPTFTPLNSSD